MKNKKNLLFFFAASLISLSSYSQTFVSTTPENKNVVLEEFTGISCGYCPDGHSIAHGIHNNNPNDVAIIAIHAGGFASPQGPGTDFRTTAGTAIDSYWGISGYPSGTVNRQSVLSRNAWAGAASQILAQPSPVNVAVQASIDMATNVLTVDVEVYYTGTQTVQTNMLNIAVVQNNVEGPQSGSSGNPSAVLPNGNYNHQHMLRHLMTGNWGEQITNISNGAFYSNQYTWTMPADINGVTLDPTNIGVIAFVAESNQEILSGTIEVAPSIMFVNSYDAYCMSSSASNIVCAPTTDLEVTFRNYGNVPLASLDIGYSINGGPSTNYPWTGNVISAGTEVVSIPGVSVTPGVTNNVTFTLSNPNGNPDQNPGNNTSSSSFDGLVSASTGNATIDVTTDNYGDEITWALEENGMVIASGGPYQGGSSIVVPTAYATLASSTCYSFTIYDTYGDGILAPGSYMVKDATGNVLASGGSNYTTEDQTNFETTGGSPPASWDCDGQGNCSDPGTGAGFYNTLAACAASCVPPLFVDETISKLSVYPNPVKDVLTINGIYKSVEIYDIYGKLVLSSNAKQTINVSTLADGIYFVNINTNNAITVKKITITK